MLVLAPAFDRALGDTPAFCLLQASEKGFVVV